MRVHIHASGQHIAAGSIKDLRFRAGELLSDGADGLIFYEKISGKYLCIRGNQPVLDQKLHA